MPMKRSSRPGLQMLPGVVLLWVVFAGTGREGRVPVLPEDPAWFATPTNAMHLGQPLLLVADAEAGGFFQERFRDREAPALLRAREASHYGGTAAVVAPRVLHPRDQGAGDGAMGAGRGWGGTSADETRTGWGWLADDVQQLRGTGASDSGPGDALLFPRRMDETDGGLSALRWLEE